MPEDFRAELIDGVVHVNMPLSEDHAIPDASLLGLLFTDRIETPWLDEAAFLRDTASP